MVEFQEKTRLLPECKYQPTGIKYRLRIQFQAECWKNLLFSLLHRISLLCKPSEGLSTIVQPYMTSVVSYTFIKTDI